MTNSSPIVVIKGKGYSLEDTFALFNECDKFEKSIAPIILRFCDYLAKEGFEKKVISIYKLACENFIGFLSLNCGIRNLLDVTKAQVGSKYLRFDNKGADFIRDRWGRKIGYQFDNRPILQKFFLYLHYSENITNKKVLRALCSERELEEAGI